MTTDTVLTLDQIDDAQESAFNKLQAEGYSGGMGGFQWDRASARAIEQAVLQSPEVQALYGLLKEARQQLPLAAACWNEDENRALADSNAKRVLDLIARIDAAMQEQKT